MIGAPPAGGGIQIPGRPGVRRGRLCDHAAQVPAVQADRFGSASDFYSSSECWTFLLCR